MAGYGGYCHSCVVDCVARKFKRNWAFWLFLLSNVLWIVWGAKDRAYALIFLQLCLGFLNARGALKNRTQS